ncbi:hypothetical protein K432DRAFT_416542 [Lepidopterella palustris CBS 459.81]|uniref:Ankyrin repeat protein n=1 Tax=Lepidopterella palustris CBS 459.81 TaxID=1314670 RepID=A0A8E2EB16_9PEZI|nr:hypothetical protein K432DRAFT_416542 [Lepidopterella palustris CBS 459.81]
MPPPPTIDLLLNLVPDRPASVLSALSQHPSLASASDTHLYSLLHAASSYAQLDLLRTLVRTYNVSPDITDEDGETPLFAAETVEVARCLVEELGASAGVVNAEGRTAEEKLSEEGEVPLVAAYLRQLTPARNGAPNPPAGGETEDIHPPPPLPDGVKIDIGTVEEQVEEVAPADPEFRRRIEELAAREDFQGSEGQRQLRELVTEAVTGLVVGQQQQQGREVRRRVE